MKAENKKEEIIPSKLLKSKPRLQTTKVIIYTILLAWLTFTMFILGAIVYTEPSQEQMSSMESMYQLITIVMIQGVIGYLIKSTMENKSKYGSVPYGGVNIPTMVLSSDNQEINNIVAATAQGETN